MSRRLYKAMSGGGADADAQAFLTATGITDATISDAINTLVIAMKNASIWDKIKALYPIVGGTEATHKYNLKDPRDLNAAFRLSFGGSWTHSANGMKPNGTTGYANTFFTLNMFSLTSIGVGSYIRENLTQFPSTLIGAGDATGVSILIDANSNDYFTLNDNWNTTPAQYITDCRGLISGQRINSSTKKLYKNSTTVSSININSNALFVQPTQPLYISCLNNGGSHQYYDNKQTALVYISQGLTDYEISDLYTIVQAFQTTLNRQV